MTEPFDPTGHSNAVGKKPSNSTEAPTNQGTIERVLPKLSEEALDFITLVDQHWGMTGTFLTAEVASNNWGMGYTQFEQFMSNPKVKDALRERGIDVDRFTKLQVDTDNAWRSASLSPIQLVVANSLLDLTDQRSDKKKLQDFGVSTATYQRWLRDPVFNTYLRERSESMLGDSQHEASLALLDKVRAGDLPSIKFYMEYTNRYITKADQAATSHNDFTSLMVKIIEIITEECDGPTAFRIAERMKEATAIHKMAVDLTNVEVVKPQVAQMREMTPELKELMEKTGGGVND